MTSNSNSSPNTFHLLSEVRLTPTSTIIHLEDYFIDPEKITGIEICDALRYTFSDDKKLLTIDVINNDFPAITPCIFSIDKEKTTLILFKSQKIKKKIEYDAHGINLHHVQIAGDMNSWNPAGYNFSYNTNSHKWEIELEIEPGNYPYQLIADGNWFTDPSNPNKTDNGYGNFNSVLVVKPDIDLLLPELYAEKCIDKAIVVSSRNTIDGFIAIYNNTLLDSSQIFINNNRYMITLPDMATEAKRSFLRVYAYNKAGASNNILIPLEHGKVIFTTNLLDRNDKEAQVIYFCLVDRFYNGNPSNDKPIEGIHPKLNYHGGDIAGITRKLKDNYLTGLGINTLWISPVVQNPEKPCEKDGVKSTGYHGYWPTISTKIDHRFGTVYEMNELVRTAHKNDINIILDYVSNHVHEDNIVYQNNKDWATPLLLPDGTKNIGRWEEHRLTTWFNEFLPTLDYGKEEVVDTMTEIALFWIYNFDLDGFRHDATKHVPTTFWRTLTKKLKENIMIRENKRLYQIGETFGGRELLNKYIGSGLLDGQFSFNVYYEARSVFAFDGEPFKKLKTALIQDLQAFGYHNLMGYITGNHDIPRFISYAGEDLAMNQNAEHEGWVRHIKVKKKIGYKKLSALTAFNCTIPGIPVIYYGDEIGMPGAGDPDNRRPMQFGNITPLEKETLAIAKKIIWIRRKRMSLNYGQLNFILCTDKQFVYTREYFNEITIAAFNKDKKETEIEFSIDSRYNETNLCLNFDGKLNKNGNKIVLSLPAYSFEILTTCKIQMPEDKGYSVYDIDNTKPH